LGYKLIKKDKSKIGKKNVGFLGTIGTLEPINVFILTFKEGDVNINSLQYKCGEHMKRISEMQDRDYKKIQITDLFVNEIDGTLKKIITDNMKNISSSTKNIYDDIINNNANGTIILFELTPQIFIDIKNILIENPDTEKNQYHL
jgi:hypothetical protein